MNADLNLARKRLDQLIASSPLADHAAVLGAIAEPSFRIIPSPADELPIGAPRLGGLPDLPDEFEWPQWAPGARLRQMGAPESATLSFIAQINLTDLPTLTTALPRSGWLYFFFDAANQPWGFDPDDRLGWRVLYYEGDAGRLKRRRPPAELSVNWLFRQAGLRYEVGLGFPGETDIVPEGPIGEEISSLDDSYLELREALMGSSGATQHRLLGHPQPVQGPMEIECQLASHGIDCGGSRDADPRAKSLRAGASEWILLLQIDTDDGTGWMWGDGGRIYYWIRRSDLRECNFENVWLCLQCY